MISPISKFLLLPIMPFLGWGPISHPFINSIVLEKANKGPKPGKVDWATVLKSKIPLGKLLTAAIGKYNELKNEALSYGDRQGWEIGDETGEEIYILAANTTDTVAAHRILNGVTIYDYSHNYIPDNVRGKPLFGYGLIQGGLHAIEKTEFLKTGIY